MVVKEQPPVHGGIVFQAARELGTEVEKIKDFSANINPLGMPPGVRLALVRALDQLQHYPEMYAETLVKQIAESCHQPESRILAGNGSTELIYLLVRVLKPENSLIVAPAFTEYQRAAKLYGGQVDFCHTLAEHDFLPRPGVIIKALAQKPDLLFLGNPNNPTGSLLSPEDLLPVLEAARRQGTVCVVDEAFIDFVEGDSSVESWLESFENLAILRSLTKIYSLAGLRCGYLLANAGLVAELRRHQEPWNVNSLAIAAAGEALADQAFVEESCRFIAGERTFLSRELSRITALRLFPSRANYLLMKLDSQYSARKLSDFLRRRYQLLIRLCPDFTGLDDSYIRVAVKDRENNQVLIRGMEDFFA
jgi:threonine-phosphate decarboxylase